MSGKPTHEPEFLFDGPETAEVTVVLAHGDGAPMNNHFLNFFASGLARQGFRVARFEFSYTTARRLGNSRRPRDQDDVLLNCWQSVIERLSTEHLVIGGKSLGGRIASMVADRNHVRGLFCLGYPFHPPPHPDKLHIEHLRGLQTPTLIVQGTNDPYGTPAEVADYRLSSAIRLHWLADADHAFGPCGTSERTTLQNRQEALDATSNFIQEILLR
ncbi:MAG: dienelactone hydrolase family protein [Defluviicoccus sp.]|nr:MAG: dienelactone hydrolase family protein [Defluviicoccus sp.]